MDIIEAVRTGDLNGLRKSLAAGADPNAPDGAGLTPLGEAARAGRGDMVKALVKARADVNQETADPTGMARRGEPVRPMLVAGLAGHWQAYQFLALRTRGSYRNAALEQLKKRHIARSRKLGAQPPVRALHRACETGDVETVAALIAQGVDVNAGDGDWGSPMLVIAASNRHATIVRLLLEAGAEPNGPIGYDSPSLMFATTPEVAEALLAGGADPNLFSLGGGLDTPLIVACRSNRREVADRLIRAGADMNVVGGTHGCALSAAIVNQADDTAKLLIASGADVNVRPKDGWPPLLHAAYLGKHRWVVDLLDAGADALHESKDTSGEPNAPPETAASLAAEQGHAEIAAILADAVDAARNRPRVDTDEA